MRVLLDTTYSRLAPCSGTAVYTRKLCEELERADGLDLIQVSNARRRPPAGGGVGSVWNALADRWWTSLELPRIARRAGVDLIHHTLPAHASRTDLPQVVTLTDLAYERLPDCFDRRFRAYAKRVYRAAALAADAVVCISETTATDARELWGLPTERIVVAPLGPGQALEVRTTDLTHFLYVGDDEPRKNLRTLIEAYRVYCKEADSPVPLILAGSARSSGPGIEVRRQPSPDELAELYAGAFALVHPSLYEGFGLTPLEAMAAGVPVIAARAPGVEEVCREAPRYANPNDPASFAQAMTELAEDGHLRDNLAERGLRRATLFSWARCARAHLDAYSLAQKRA